MDSSLPANEYIPGDFTVNHGNNLSAFLCSCVCSWTLGCMGVGDLKSPTGGPLFGKEVVLLNRYPNLVYPATPKS